MEIIKHICFSGIRLHLINTSGHTCPPCIQSLTKLISQGWWHSRQYSTSLPLEYATELIRVRALQYSIIEHWDGCLNKPIKPGLYYLSSHLLCFKIGLVCISKGSIRLSNLSNEARSIRCKWTS